MYHLHNGYTTHKLTDHNAESSLSVIQMVNVLLPESGIALLILIKETQIVMLRGSGIILDCHDSEKNKGFWPGFLLSKARLKKLKC